MAERKAAKRIARVDAAWSWIERLWLFIGSTVVGGAMWIVAKIEDWTFGQTFLAVIVAMGAGAGAYIVGRYLWDAYDRRAVEPVAESPTTVQTSNPANIDQFIPLERAASDAYSLARGTQFGEAAEDSYLSPSGPLIWFANYFLSVAKVPFHGNVRNSSKQERTRLEGCHFHLENDRIVAKDDAVVWENLSLSQENYDRAIARLKESLDVD